ncbi:uncharacterized protein MELLADRAFT_59992 [Melampsora larici-populina 98AG31]|uniref:Uncharacterized protein n=1 Tax=Melampsora larici-populina (strain 98AG31 / pathotype 3-4-7) TaxID=747676 RepID=F4R9K2_MELLP|nr:uncharacterized protein MELLADRAFT_59992 [Melampsora larici-populina 98AG31]EGG10994.1 hypothetical protein MELLADRAFT_59992 [Melampsora larici-populina 98AG31]
MWRQLKRKTTTQNQFRSNHMIQAIKLAEEKKRMQEQKETEQADKRRRRAESRRDTQIQEVSNTQDMDPIDDQPTTSAKALLEIKKEMVEGEQMKEKEEQLREGGSKENVGRIERDSGTEDSSGEEGEEEDTRILEMKRKGKEKAKKRSPSVSSIEETERKEGKGLVSLIETDQMIPGRKPTRVEEESSSKKQDDARPLLDRLVEALEGKGEEEEGERREGKKDQEEGGEEGGKRKSRNQTQIRRETR